MARLPDGGRDFGERDFDRMMARHKVAIERAQHEIERARQAMDERLARLRAAMEAAKDEFLRALDGGNVPLDAAERYRDVWGSWPDRMSGKRRPPRPPRPPRAPRPWRGLDGGDPVPVEPRPKPKPLIDGAEAPIE